MLIILRLLRASKAAPIVVYRQPVNNCCEDVHEPEIKVIPQEIVVSSGSSNQNLVFRRVLPTELNKLRPRMQRIDLNNPLNALPATVVNIGTILGTPTLFRAIVDPSTLMRFADGSFSATVRGAGGSFAASAGYKMVTPAEVFAPILVFQAASIITGQYYLHGITKQLSAIDEKIQVLINLHHNEKSSILQSHYEILMQMYDNQHYSPQDLNDLRAIYRDVNLIRHEYTNLLSSIDTSDYADEFLPILAKNKLAELDRRVINHRTANYADMILCAERIRFAAKLLEFKCNISLCKSDPQRIYDVLRNTSEISKILESISQPEWLSSASKQLEDAVASARSIWTSAILKSNEDKALRLAHKYNDWNTRLKDEYRSFLSESSDTVKEINTEIGKPRELLLSVDDEGRVECMQLTARKRRPIIRSVIKRIRNQKEKGR